MRVSVGASVGASVRASVGASVSVSASASVGASVGVGDSAGAEATGDCRCRSCGRLCLAVVQLLAMVPDPRTRYCRGDCWGFFQASRRSKGFISLDDPKPTTKS